MTAYELASLYTQIGDNINAQLTNWLAIVSLYLGAGFLVAHRLSLLSAIALRGIFVLVAGTWTLTFFRTFGNLIGVSSEIRKLAEKNLGLEWHQAALMPESVLANVPTVSTIMLWVIIVAALFFFFSSRHQNLKAQRQAS